MAEGSSRRRYHWAMPLDAILDRRLLLISGKGGVGKTTVAASLGILASRQDVRVLIAEVQGKGALPALFGTGRLTASPTELRPGLYGMSISPEEALQEYFDVQLHLKRFAKPLIRSQLVYYVTHAAPGLRDILMLGKVWYAATRRREFDLIVLDAHAAGHVISMLRSPEGLLHAMPIGPLAGHARKVAEWLRDPDQVSINLVSVAEEMPVNETVETTRILEEQVGMRVDHIFLNMLYPPLAEDPRLPRAFSRLDGPSDLISQAAEAGTSLATADAERLFACGSFYRDRRNLQQRHRKNLMRQLGPTAPIVDLPLMFRERFGIKELDFLADAIEEQIGS